MYHCEKCSSPITKLLNAKTKKTRQHPLHRNQDNKNYKHFKTKIRTVKPLPHLSVIEKKSRAIQAHETYPENNRSKTTHLKSSTYLKTYYKLLSAMSNTCSEGANNLETSHEYKTLNYSTSSIEHVTQKPLNTTQDNEKYIATKALNDISHENKTLNYYTSSIETHYSAQGKTHATKAPNDITTTRRATNLANATRSTEGNQKPSNEHSEQQAENMESQEPESKRSREQMAREPRARRRARRV